MKTIHKITFIINAFITLAILFAIIGSSTLLAVFASSIGILVILVLMVIPIVWGSIFSFRNLFKKEKNLTLFEKILLIFPLINLLVLIFIFAAISFN